MGLCRSLVEGEPLSRRETIVLAAAATLAACSCARAGGEAEGEAGSSVVLGDGLGSSSEPTAAALPAADPDPESEFCVDRAVNMDTIDEYLGVPGVAYRDMRMVEDPAAYADIGGSSNLDYCIESFKIVPFPYIGTLAPLPVTGAYDGPTLFAIEWGEGLEVLAVSPNYEQSLEIVHDLFPEQGPIVLMCGGGGYAAMMRALLLYLGYDERLLYNAGGMWEYLGYHSVELISYDDNGRPDFHLWRADIASIDFALLTPIE